MSHMFRNQAFFNLNENPVSFYKNMRQEDALKFYNTERISKLKGVFKKELEVLAMSLPDLCDGFSFEDEQLISVLGKKSHKNDQELYAEMLEIVRNNPLNKQVAAKGINTYIRPIIQGKLWNNDNI